MNQIIPLLRSHKLPIDDDAEQLSISLTTDIIDASDRMDDLIARLYEVDGFSPDQAELIDLLNQKILVFQLKASALSLMPQDGGSHDR